MGWDGGLGSIAGREVFHESTSKQSRTSISNVGGGRIGVI